MRERREADRRPHVVRKNEERAAVTDEPAVQRDTVEDRTHPVLPHSEMEVPSRPLLGAERRRAFYVGVVRPCQVCRTTDQLGEFGRERVDDLPRRRARRLRVLRTERRQRRVPPIRERPRQAPVELGREIGMRPTIGVPLPLPFGLETAAALPRLAPMRERFLWYVERLDAWPAEVLLRELDLVDAQGRAVRLGAVLLVRAPPADV